MNCRKAKLYRWGRLEEKTPQGSDGGNTHSGTYNLETNNFIESRSGRESLKVIDNHFKAYHQLGVMLLENNIDGIGGDLGSKWIVDKIFPCQPRVLDQGSTNDFIER